MAPIAIDEAVVLPIDPRIKDVAQPKKDSLGLPAAARERLTKAGVDLSKGYPYRPARPLYLQDAYEIRNVGQQAVLRGALYVRVRVLVRALLST